MKRDAMGERENKIKVKKKRERDFVCVCCCRLLLLYVYRRERERERESLSSLTVTALTRCGTDPLLYSSLHHMVDQKVVVVVLLSVASHPAALSFLWSHPAAVETLGCIILFSLSSINNNK
jgi:hypothetical protein